MKDLVFDWDKGVRDKDRTLTETHRKRISLSKTGAKNPRARKVLDQETGRVYDTLTAAAASINVKPSTLTNKLLGRRNNDTVFIYLNNNKRAWTTKKAKDGLS